jgi:predicted RND superfamily exporter protein
VRDRLGQLLLPDSGHHYHRAASFLCNSTAMKWIANLIADHPLRGWLLVILLSIGPAIGWLNRTPRRTDLLEWVTPDEVADLIRARELFRNGLPVVAVLEADSFFRPDRLRALSRAASELRSHPEVRDLMWLGDLPDVTLTGRVRPRLPSPEAAPERLLEADAALRTHPLAAGQLISHDGRTLVFLIDTSDFVDLTPIRAILAESLEPAGIRVRLTGGLPLFQLQDQTLARDTVRIQLLAYVLVALLALIVFRNPLAVVIAGSGPVAGVLWTTGWLHVTGLASNELAAIILPVMIMMVGFADGVHLVMAAEHQMLSGATRADAVRTAVQESGAACLLTSVTTSIGFGSLLVSQSNLIAGFAKASLVGVVASFVAVILVTPLMANSFLMRTPTRVRRRVLERLLQAAQPVLRIPLQHSRLVSIGGILVTLLCLVCALKLEPDDRLSRRVPQDSEAWQALQHCEQHFGGVRQLRVILHWPESLKRRDLWPLIAQCEDAIRADARLGSPLSIRTCLTVFRGSGSPDRFLLLNQLPLDLQQRFYNREERCTLITSRLHDRSYATWQEAFGRLQTRVDAIQAAVPGVRIEVISDALVEGRIVDRMIRDLMPGLFGATIVIFCVLGVAFRSIRLGLIAMLPNVLPLAASGALHWLVTPSLSVAGACSFAICLGIAVDDTVHYLTHFTQQRRKGKSPREANEHTMTTVGSALIMTTLVMLAGLGSVLTTNLPAHFQFAAMGVVTMLVALPADLFVTPALLMLFPGSAAPAEHFRPGESVEAPALESN